MDGKLKEIVTFLEGKVAVSTDNFTEHSDLDIYCSCLIVIVYLRKIKNKFLIFLSTRGGL